ncbi:hypothetical protein PISMIDRAFT_679524 [Pisolithus microcarpus 441]|uniref:Uncharacterized protein n=1 Tax=Pisolithus microcarpus 441 TaxID=765257 RepID=A0A0C9Z2I2_9AGAM|nr:hypothetical protein PISMIDRAFT_679524 [Pisolithus microcarpus 441]
MSSRTRRESICDVSPFFADIVSQLSHVKGLKVKALLYNPATSASIPTWVYV